jgi:hypothetical protein
MCSMRLLELTLGSAFACLLGAVAMPHGRWRSIAECSVDVHPGRPISSSAVRLV